MSNRTIVVGYADLMDGVRSYYARREGDDTAAAFSAAMLLAAMFVVNLASITMLIDMVLFRELRFAHWVGAHRGLALPLPLGIAAAHYWFAKVTGVCDRRGPARMAAWSVALKIYITMTVLLLGSALLTVVVLRR